MKKWAISLLVVAFIGVILLSCSKPAMMPAKHLNDAPAAPGNEIARSVPTFMPAEDPRDKVIKTQDELIKLYELRINELEAKVKELEKKP